MRDPAPEITDSFRTRPSGSPGPVVLSCETDFPLGGGLVRPPLCQFLAGDTAHTLQPRVMQTLVFFGRRPGVVVTRDDLIAGCWAGRIVGRDAIERCVAKVRRLGVASGTFSIETIPRVGYRLLPARGAATVERRHPRDPEADALYLRGMRLSLHATAEDFRHAEQLFTEAVARAPNFAPAWAGLASTRAALLEEGPDVTGSPEHAAARAAVERALALDPGCAMAYRIQALLKPPFADYTEKLALARRALAAGPTESFSLMMMAGALGAVGRVREALPFALQAVAQEPTSPFAAAVATALLDALGRTAEARTLLRQARDRMPEGPWILFAQNAITKSQEHAATRAGECGEQAFAALLTTDAPLALPVCLEAAHRGCVDLAFAHLFEALDQGRAIVVPGAMRSGLNRAFITNLLFSGRGAALRRDIRFASLCARLGLATHWQETGAWPDCAEDPLNRYDFRAECARALAAISSR